MTETEHLRLTGPMSKVADQGDWLGLVPEGSKNIDPANLLAPQFYRVSDTIFLVVTGSQYENGSTNDNTCVIAAYLYAVRVDGPPQLLTWTAKAIFVTGENLAVDSSVFSSPTYTLANSEMLPDGRLFQSIYLIQDATPRNLIGSVPIRVHDDKTLEIGQWQPLAEKFISPMAESSIYDSDAQRDDLTVRAISPLAWAGSLEGGEHRLLCCVSAMTGFETDNIDFFLLVRYFDTDGMSLRARGTWVPCWKRRGVYPPTIANYAYGLNGRLHVFAPFAELSDHGRSSHPGVEGDGAIAVVRDHGQGQAHLENVTGVFARDLGGDYLAMQFGFTSFLALIAPGGSWVDWARIHGVVQTGAEESRVTEFEVHDEGLDAFQANAMGMTQTRSRHPWFCPTFVHGHGFGAEPAAVELVSREGTLVERLTIPREDPPISDAEQNSTHIHPRWLVIGGHDNASPRGIHVTTVECDLPAPPEEIAARHRAQRLRFEEAHNG